MTATKPSNDISSRASKLIDDYIASLHEPLYELNKSIHSHPELAYQEKHAHDAISTLLENLGVEVTRHAYGLATSFEAVTINGCGPAYRSVNFNAEYDALPDIGHACGHNLIAVASITAFLAATHAIRELGIEGRLQLLGTPAEEDGGGKIQLLDAGAYKNIDVSLMIHPSSELDLKKLGSNVVGVAGKGSIACYDLTATFKGVSAHAGTNPWEGVNALDALVASYNNVSMLRQQMEPNERVHCAILEAPKVTNVIPEQTKIRYTIRSPRMEGTRKLGERVRGCLEAGALAAGCQIEIEEEPMYADLRSNMPLCEAYQTHMLHLGTNVAKLDPEPITGSTDQGNVTHVIPGLHAIVGIPTDEGAHNHTPHFTASSGSLEAYERTLTAGKALALTALDVLSSDSLYERVRHDFEQDKLSR